MTAAGSGLHRAWTLSQSRIDAYQLESQAVARHERYKGKHIGSPEECKHNGNTAADNMRAMLEESNH